MKKNFWNWIIERAKERSTWLGITAFLAAVGIGLSPEQTEAIVTGGIALAGAITAFTRDA